MAGVNRWLLGARPRTLPAALVPVAVGTAAAVGVSPGGIVWWRALCAAVVAVALQVATNYVNDYADGNRGTDDDRVGPVRLVGSGLATASQVKTAAGVAFAVAGLAGLALAVAVGWELLLVGVLSFVAGWAYTGGPKPYGYLGLGELFVFVFFGLVATMGSTYVQIETLTGLSAMAAVPVGLLSTELLITNNLRDIPTDRQANKMTLAARMGDRGTRRLYGLLWVGVAAGIVACATVRPPAAVGLAGLVLAIGPVRAVMGLGRPAAAGHELLGVLAATAKAQLVIGGLLAAGLAVGG